MSKHTLTMLAIVGIVVVVGVLVVHSETAHATPAPSSGGVLGEVSTIFKSGASIFGGVEKAFPSWFDSTPDPTDANLGSFASSAGFVDQSKL
jgi:ABC-type xylose transport system permease subunit